MASPPSSSSLPVSPLPSSFSVLDCGWLGFDLDHALARYNLSTFGPLVFELVMRHLVERQHMSPSLLDVPFDPSFAGKGVAFDSLTGHCIKLDAQGRVRVAQHGLQQLSEADIAAAYPAPLQSIDEDRRFLVVHTSFETCSPYILAHLVSRLDAGTLFPSASSSASASTSASPPTAPSSSSPYARLVPSLISAFEFEFGSWHRGSYFAALRSDVGRYVHRRPEVRQWLEAIKQQQQRGLFLVTNSRADYTELLCRHILGDEWRSLFDYIVVDATKPAFFRDSGRPFYPLDADSLAADATQPLPTDQPLPRGLFVHGSAAQLTLSLRAARPSDSRPIVYFDDHLQSGVAAIRQHRSDWLAGAVVEELSTHDAAAAESTSAYCAPLSCDTFGHALSVQQDGSYWDRRMRQSAHLSLPCLSHIAHIHAAGQQEQWVVDKLGHMSLALHTQPAPL